MIAKYFIKLINKYKLIIRHLFWILQIRLAHFLQNQLSKRNLSFTFQLSHYELERQSFDSNEFPLSNVGIVIQGPILVRGDLTLNICKSIHNLYPTIPIILSTWSIKDSSYFRKFEDLGVFVQICTPPEYSGIGNINMQITNTREGLLKAKQMGCKYVLKMRTDTWFSEPDFLLYFCEEFLCESQNMESTPIIVISFNTSRVREFSINDQIQFGQLSDLLIFWNAPLDSRKIEDLPFPLLSAGPTQHSMNRLAEVWLVTHYLESKGIFYEFTQRSYLEIIATLFVVVDESVVGMIWHKSVLRDIRSLRNQRTSLNNPNFLRSEWMRIRRIIDSQNRI